MPMSMLSSMHNLDSQAYASRDYVHTIDYVLSLVLKDRPGSLILEILQVLASEERSLIEEPLFL